MVLPFENDNLKIVKTLAKRSFLASRFRNLVAVLAIALTAVLFTTVTTIGMGTMESMQMTQQIMKMSKSDADIRNLTREQYEDFKEWYCQRIRTADAHQFSDEYSAAFN